jgi:murein DD-endopeptidase MepM/ murein hydrolase activator NlpD
MSKKFISLIIIPHNKSKSKTLSISKKTAKISLGVAIFLFLALVFFLADYFTMNVTRKKYKTLLNENANQKQTLAQYQETINSLQSTINQFESYAKKLNVMAGLKSQDTLEGEPGIGGFSNDQETSLPTTSQDLKLENLDNISQKADLIEKNLHTLTNFFEDQTLRLAATPTIFPTKGYLSSAYGWRDDPFTGKRTFHHGIDIATHYGNPIIATADGVVIMVRSDKIGGKTIKIKHMFGYTTVYCHLSKYLVKVGQKVKRGETIGLVGNTGKARGPHVHYEVHLNGKEKNPYYYLLEE